jgi:predicted lysophospholipase L1 biosynthesis ABC-type transport system permease subunit
VIIINERAAKTLWPDRSAVGQVAIAGNGPVRVVGVVGNVRYQALEQEAGLEMYFPLTQQTMGSVELVVRTKLPPESLAPSVRTALRSIEPTLPTAEFKVLGELVDRAVSPRRFMMLLLTGFAVAALLLASIGIYGVVSYSVSQRTQEIGIRMALGASTRQVQRHVMTKTVALVSGGVVIGVLGALALGRLTASLLYRLEPADPLTFGVTVAALLGVALSAGYLPARRASRVDPMSALRTD